MRNRVALLTLFMLLCSSIPGAQSQPNLPDFRVKQCGGEEKVFQLSQHKGSWVLLDFILAEPNAADASHYAVLSASSEKLQKEAGLTLAVLCAGERDAVAAWWATQPNRNLPVYRDPEGRLSQAVEIPMGLKLGERPVHYPATLLIDPTGAETWRFVAKNENDRVDMKQILAALDKATAETAQKEKKMSELADGGEVVETKTGLKYTEMKAGTGESPKSGQKVNVHYTGWLTNGKKFDSSVDRGTPFSFVLGQGQVIKGWDEGVASMKVGGKRKLIIPPALGYGARGAGGVIPPNAELIFEVELLSID